MSIEFKLPELGEHIPSGDVVKILVHEGDQIEGNQSVIELETEKAVVEIPCPYPGKIAKILVTKGQTVKVGQPILTVESTEEAPAAPAPAAEPTVVVSKSEETQPAPKATSAPVVPETIPAGPAARRLARELGVDLREVEGSGTRGRITPEDVQAAAEAIAPTTAPAPAAPVAPAAPAKAAGPTLASMEPVVPPGEPDQDAWGSIRRERMSRIRKTIAAQMARSASTIPHVTNFDDADITELEELRRGVPKDFLGANVKLTTLPFVMKAVALGLRRHPLLNASLDEENEQIIYKEYVHLGIAVDTPRGLVVPAVRDVDRMSIPEIARALASVSERARAVRFAVEELRGGTFTISNLGAVGGTYSTPIINYPEVAILLLGRSRWMPVMREPGKGFKPRLMMPLSLSYDHRIVDGATAARFLNEVISSLQSPASLLLNR